MYNITDWTAGMTHFIKGCTLFVNPWHELTLDPDDSVILTPGALPILSVKQITKHKLGRPYGHCIRRTYPLKFFEQYTKKHCQMECLIDVILLKCHCYAPFFPTSAKSDNMLGCNFTQHTFCVSNQIVTFDNSKCICSDECEHGKN